MPQRTRLFIPPTTVEGGGTRNWAIAENSVFMVKPVIMTEGRAKSVVWGDSVVATPSGARRLGKRPPALIEIV